MPEIKEQLDQNEAINNRLQDNQEEVFPNNLDTMSEKEVAETLTNIIAEGAKITPESGYIASVDPVVAGNNTLANVVITKKETGEVVKPTMQEIAAKPKTRKATPAVGKPVDTATVIEKLQEQAQKAQKQILLIQWADSYLHAREWPEDMDKPTRELLLQYVKELEAVRATYIQKIQSL